MGETCAMCGSEELKELGTLGSMYWVRCSHCGAEQNIEIEQEAYS